MKRWQRSPSDSLELSMRTAQPLVAVADSHCELTPDIARVQRLGQRALPKLVLALQLGARVPAHVPQNAAEVENQSADRHLWNSGMRYAWSLSRPIPIRDRQPPVPPERTAGNLD